MHSRTRIGPYEIAASIGAGGMGEVFRARDTRLNRDVAVKVLPEDFASDADRLRRFEREALFALAFLTRQTMKILITIIRTVVALVALAAPLLAAAPASLVHFTPVSEWPGGQQEGGLAVSGNYAYLRAGYPDLRIIDVSDPANPLRVDKGNLPAGAMSDVAVANGHLFLPKQGIYRIDEVPAVGPTLSMKMENPGLLDLRVQSPGFDDFTLMTSTTVTNWQPYATVFSRVENFRVFQDGGPQNEPARFYQAAGEGLSPAAMFLQWKAAGIPRYRFRFERSCFCSPKVLSGMVTVENGMITRVDDEQGNEIPMRSSNRLRDSSHLWSPTGEAQI